jgi:hypothetical protein
MKLRTNRAPAVAAVVVAIAAAAVAVVVAAAAGKRPPQLVCKIPRRSNDRRGFLFGGALRYCASKKLMAAARQKGATRVA